ESMLERTSDGAMFCNVCSHETVAEERSAASALDPTRRKKRFTSLDDLVARTGLRRDELVTLADIGALNSFGYDRRSAMWQAERAARPAGELFENLQFTRPCPLSPMTEAERLVADYAGTKLTIGRHPMALRREDLAMRGILRACDLHSARQGR